MSDSPHTISVEEERRLAHTGALAKLAGGCARHPFRVIFSWVAIIVVLFGLNAAYGGKLVDNFSVPGTDFQKATNLINAKFGGQKGAALRVVVAAPPGERIDTPAREAAIATMLGQSAAAQANLDANRADVSPIKNPIAPGSHTLSANGRIAFFDAQFDKDSFSLPRSGIVSLENQLRATGAPAGL